MTLPHNALVLVADGRKLLFLRNQGDAGRIDLRIEAHDEQALFKDGDMKSDAPGTGHQSGGYDRPTVDEPDYHQQAEDRWATHAAEILRQRALGNEFDALAIVAPPKMLGELRKHLHKEVERRVILQLPKEMTDRPVADIEALLTTKAASPA